MQCACPSTSFRKQYFVAVRVIILFYFIYIPVYNKMIHLHGQNLRSVFLFGHLQFWSSVPGEKVLFVQFFILYILFYKD